MEKFDRLVSIVKTLRAPEGCPWDKEQTFHSLTPYIIEEAYELVEAIKAESFSDIQEELGDILLHVVMLSNMAEEHQQFTIDTVVEDISEKMIRRHPHVFSDVKVHSVKDVWKNWEHIKRQEKNRYMLDSVPSSLPALMHAHKIQKKAARVGFDWNVPEGPLEKIREEIDEIQKALEQNEDKKRVKEEFGDLLFSMVNVARKWNIDPEDALQSSIKKFRTRFEWMEKEVAEHDRDIQRLTPLEWDALWKKAKQQQGVL